MSAIRVCTLLVAAHLLVVVVLTLPLLLRSAAQHALQHLDQRLLPVVRRAGARDRRQRPCQARLHVSHDLRQLGLLCNMLSGQTASGSGSCSNAQSS